MVNINNRTQKQPDICILGKIDDFCKQFKIATNLHRCGIRKRQGHSVRSLIMAIFTFVDAKKRLCGAHKKVDKRSCAWQRRKEATMKSTEQLESRPSICSWTVGLQSQ